MIKALSAVALGAFVAAGITVLLGFAPQVEASVPAPQVEASVPAPQVEASVPAPLGKSDRLEIQEVGSDCSDDRIWPNPCLREVGYEILKDQLVTAERARQGRPG
jgi:hypothetical protein